MNTKSTSISLAVLLTLTGIAHAGVYARSSLPLLDQPGRINHVAGYTGAAATITIEVCANNVPADFNRTLLLLREVLG